MLSSHFSHCFTRTMSYRNVLLAGLLSGGLLACSESSSDEPSSTSTTGPSTSTTATTSSPTGATGAPTSPTSTTAPTTPPTGTGTSTATSTVGPTGAAPSTGWTDTSDPNLVDAGDASVGEAGDASSPDTSGSDTSGSSNPGAFTLSSPDHSEGAAFAPEVTCEACGFNADQMVMPGLQWTAGPEGTLSYAVTFIDRTLVDMSNPLGYHWALWNIPGDVTTLPKGMKQAELPLGATQTGNFLGPCPDVSEDEAHTYELTVWALPTATIDITGSGTAAVQAALDRLATEAVAHVTLTGTSFASPGQPGSCN
jgi:phosphatidylethanolamine-binding protein (PEBP) family uncharacterized protein